MNCAICGSSNAQENCHSCEAWICAGCAHEYDGYYFCPLCYVERTGETVEGLNDLDDDVDFDDDDDLDYQKDTADDQEDGDD
ncbi:MAG: hypothetical protein JW958_10165 [Candidatus Eisenbacteria bacterium]|nr:hypothetical protein [Candidatus Eisenbacteria bacterium]